MKNILFSVATIGLVFSVHAVSWKGLSDANYYSGPKLSEEDLAGKVVMVDEWGVYCPPCRALLPQMQKYWNAFKTKPFMLVGSHRQGSEPGKVAELVKINSLTYPIYESFGIAEGEPSNGGGIPFIYVINHRGKVVYSGRNDREAIEAAQNAILSIGLPPTLTTGVIFGKKHPYRMLEKQLVLGKAIAPIEKKLRDDIKKSESKTATPALKANAEKAKELLDAIAASKIEVKEEIEYNKTANPPEAVKLINAFSKSFPEDAKDYKEILPQLSAAAKEFAATHKAKEEAPKK